MCRISARFHLKSCSFSTIFNTLISHGLEQHAEMCLGNSSKVHSIPLSKLNRLKEHFMLLGHFTFSPCYLKSNNIQYIQPRMTTVITDKPIRVFIQFIFLSPLNTTPLFQRFFSSRSSSRSCRSEEFCLQPEC